MTTRATRALHNVGATEAIPGLSGLTGNVNAIAEEANRIGVQKVCRLSRWPQFGCADYFKLMADPVQASRK
jgi:hypothetical protein